MAINQEYFGSQETWATATTESNNQQFEFKVANWNPSDTTIGKGDYKYKFGQLFNETGEYIVNLDISTAYCAMDSNAPFVHRFYSSARYDSTHYHARIDLAPTTDTPIGWYAGSIPDYMVILPEGYQTDFAPVNFKPLWEDPAWHPTISTSNGQRTLGYIGSNNSPVLSFSFKNIKLVPIIRCCAFRSGKTKADLQNATTYEDFASVVDLSSEMFIPLGTYLNDSYNNTPFYEAFPVICSLYVAPVLLYFDDDGNLAIPPNCSSKYNSTAMRNYGNMKEALHVDIFPTDKVAFTELISRYGTVYDDASCEAKLFPTRKIATNFIYYNYNGGSYPRGSLNVYEQGAFCIGGRCAGGANNYNFMNIRAIDTDTFKVYADTDDADIDCGVLVDDFGTLDDFAEYVRKSVAYFGMFFTDDIEPAVEEKSTMDTAGLHLGFVDENGITHGTYTTGDQNPLAPNYEWEDPMDDTPWTPGGGGGEGDNPSDNDEYNRDYSNWNNDLASSFYNIYKFTSPYYSLYYKITDRLCNPNAWQSYWDNKLYNPISCIIVNHLMPSNLISATTGAKHVVAGGLDLTDSIEPVPTITDTYKSFNVGTFDINEALQDFNDYSSTAIYIHLPYIGVKQLDTEAVMGGQLGITYVADCLTGDCLATVWVKDRAGNSKYRYEFKGNCARPIYLSTYTPPGTIIGSAVAGVIGGLAMGAVGGLIAGAGASVIGNAAAAIDSAGSISGAFGSGGFGWMLEEMGKQPAAVGTSVVMGAMNGARGGSSGMKGGATTSSNASGGSVSTPIDTQCYLIVVRPVESKPSNYKGLFGIPSDKAGKIKDFSGFLSVRGVRLDGVVATEQEKKEINSILFNGIYINQI